MHSIPGLAALKSSLVSTMGYLRFTKLFLTVVFSLLCLTLLAFADDKGPCQFPAIFNFGDSNSDTGGLSAAFGQAAPPNGETYFHAPEGRYSDGRLIIDFMAESLGLPHLSAFLDAMGANFTRGANFATAGSTIRPQNQTMRQNGLSPISLDVQYTEFIDFKRRSQIIRNKGGFFMGLMPKAEDFPRALYTFDIGQNDLVAGYFLNLTSDQVKASVPDMVGQFKNAVQILYEHGARSFWTHNTGPAGCLPYVMDRDPITATQVNKVECTSPVNEVAQYFNLKLKEAVVELRQSLPGAAWTYVDVYAVKYDLISQAKKYGFLNPFIACCGHGGKFNFNIQKRCGTKITVDGKEILLAKSCKDPSKVINWDGIHFTEAGNKWIFDKIVDGAYSDPPIPLRMACHRR